MVLAIVREMRTNKNRIEEYSRGDWDTMMLALRIKRAGNWDKVKVFVHSRRLHKKKGFFR